VAIALHWGIALLLAGQFAWGWWMLDIPKQPPGPRADAFNLHKSFGLLILALTVGRLAWRLGHPAPALPSMPDWQKTLAHATHVMLYAVAFALPLSGYLGSAFSGYPVKFFGQTLPAWALPNPALKEFFSAVHYGASWLLAMLVAAHVAGAIKHALLDRDGSLRRMLPARQGR
jgi:cytochrome b561